MRIGRDMPTGGIGIPNAHPHTITEIDLASDQEQAERGGTAATDLQLESEQRAMQALYDYQHAARTAREADGQSVPLPSLQTYSDLPREWPMARLAISNKQINLMRFCDQTDEASGHHPELLLVGV